MIRSMTGFGAAEGRVGALRVSVELRTVNHRFFNPSIKLPPVLGRFEGEVRELLRQRIARGHATLFARAERAPDAPSAVVDEERFAGYVSQLRGLAERHGLATTLDVATVLRLPAVLLDRISVVEQAYARIAGRSPVRLAEQRDRLRANVRELAEGVAVDEQRLVQELAILADRLDVSEEIDRFRMHLAAFRAALSDGTAEPVGKRLGFLLQEMLREANTTGSKSNDAPMLHDVVLVKEELERIREQVENVE